LSKYSGSDITVLDPSTVAVGELNFADGLKNKRVYLTGFEAGINVVMQYWKSGIDTADAEQNLEHIKDMIKANASRNVPKVKG
jgi:hypothetical protein